METLEPQKFPSSLYYSRLPNEWNESSFTSLREKKKDEKRGEPCALTLTRTVPHCQGSKGPPSGRRATRSCARSLRPSTWPVRLVPFSLVVEASVTASSAYTILDAGVLDTFDSHWQSRTVALLPFPLLSQRNLRLQQRSASFLNGREPIHCLVSYNF